MRLNRLGTRLTDTLVAWVCSIGPSSIDGVRRPIERSTPHTW